MRIQLMKWHHTSGEQIFLNWLLVRGFPMVHWVLESSHRVSWSKERDSVISRGRCCTRLRGGRQPCTRGNNLLSRGRRRQQSFRTSQSEQLCPHGRRRKSRILHSGDIQHGYNTAKEGKMELQCGCPLYSCMCPACACIYTRISSLQMSIFPWNCVLGWDFSNSFHSIGNEREDPYSDVLRYFHDKKMTILITIHYKIAPVLTLLSCNTMAGISFSSIFQCIIQFRTDFSKQCIKSKGKNNTCYYTFISSSVEKFCFFLQLIGLDCKNIWPEVH